MVKKIYYFTFALSVFNAFLIMDIQAQNPTETASIGKNNPELAASMIEAQRAAKDFVELLDNGRYKDSWTQGSVLFQRTINPSEWIFALQLARKIRKRAIKSFKR
jgi:hypothetical protein